MRLRRNRDTRADDRHLRAYNSFDCNSAFLGVAAAVDSTVGASADDGVAERVSCPQTPVSLTTEVEQCLFGETAVVSLDVGAGRLVISSFGGRGTWKMVGTAQ